MKKAFTLIELLVVIAIIAILAAILFPVFAQAKAAAKQTSSLSNVKQLMTSILIYNGDYDDNTMTELWQNRGDGEWTTWMETLLPYVKNTQIFLDPGGQTDKNAVGVTGCTSPAGAKVYSNWAMVNWVRYSYWNWYGTVMFGGFPIAPTPANTASGGVCDPAALAANPARACVGFPNVAEPASTVFLIPGYMVSYPRATSKFGWPCTTGFSPFHGKPDPVNEKIHPYRKGANYGFIDSHAKFMTSMKANGDGSRPKSFQGGTYPSSPYMVVVE